MIKKLIIGVLLNGAALYAVVYLMPKEIIYTGGLAFFALGGVVMGILNTFVKPILKLITLPIQIITLGLSLIIINGIIFWIFDQIIATLVIEGITLQIKDPTTYLFGGVIFGTINYIEHLIFHHA